MRLRRLVVAWEGNFMKRVNSLSNLHADIPCVRRGNAVLRRFFVGQLSETRQRPGAL